MEPDPTDELKGKYLACIELVTGGRGIVYRLCTGVGAVGYQTTDVRQGCGQRDIIGFTGDAGVRIAIRGHVN